MRGSRWGGTGVPDPPENAQNIGFLSNTGPNPLNNHKATKLAFNVGPSLTHQPNAISIEILKQYFISVHRISI